MKAIGDKEFADMVDRLQEEALKLPATEWNWMLKLETLEKSTMTHAFAITLAKSPTDYLKRLSVSLLTLGYFWGKQEAEVGSLEKLMAEEKG